ncbi:fumarylacetoacetate hydrolase family protein [Aspergillus pseudoustus]|uniref:Fumarylacetoacetate hydrolase family protein n=1 Tax=Aspergillus pseudoustus TaxID=1810923 RepID=A0ABR4IPG8_9EURO
MAFKSLVRFAHDSCEHYGDLLEYNEGAGTFLVQKLDGSPFGTLTVTGETLQVEQLLCPLEDTPTIICVGLNYREHATEAKLEIPRDPVIFTKPPDALATSDEPIPIHPDAQAMLDYEGELVVVIGRDSKEITEADALDYVLGYTSGNDLSARDFQGPSSISGGQFCYAKSFDGFAPIGQYITAAAEVPDPQGLFLVTKVNGVQRQASSTSDMIWTVRRLIAHLSRGRTLRAGSLIMTGTPSGVGYATNQFLRDGDLVEVSISGLATTTNTISFEKAILHGESKQSGVDV